LILLFGCAPASLMGFFSGFPALAATNGDGSSLFLSALSGLPCSSRLCTGMAGTLAHDLYGYYPTWLSFCCSILQTLSLVSLPFAVPGGDGDHCIPCPGRKKSFQPGWKPATVLVTAASLETERDVPPHTRVL
jgi:hypothetical protein